MTIDHVALYAKDLEGMKDFFVEYFNAIPGELYHNEKKGFKSYFLSFDSGARLEIMNRGGLDAASQGNSCGYAHIAIKTGSRAEVDNLTSRLARDGFRVASPARVTGDGYYESCILGPEGIMVEITG